MSFTNSMDFAQIVLYAFWVFFALLVYYLRREDKREGYPLDVIACGGAQDGETYAAFASMGVRAAQYWSALIYRGPLAAALIECEARKMGVFADDRFTD